MSTESEFSGLTKKSIQIVVENAAKLLPCSLSLSLLARRGSTSFAENLFRSDRLAPVPPFVDSTYAVVGSPATQEAWYLPNPSCPRGSAMHCRVLTMAVEGLCSCAPSVVCLPQSEDDNVNVTDTRIRVQPRCWRCLRTHPTLSYHESSSGICFGQIPNARVSHCECCSFCIGHTAA